LLVRLIAALIARLIAALIARLIAGFVAGLIAGWGLSCNATRRDPSLICVSDTDGRQRERGRLFGTAEIRWKIQRRVVMVPPLGKSAKGKPNAEEIAMTRYGWIAGLALLGTMGCILDDGPTESVPSHPFGHVVAPQPRAVASFAPASTATAARVDMVGRTITQANPQLGMKPLFRTIGAPMPEVFHIGTAEVDVTEGLVNQCKTDGQLAAVLCQELGKMISEREAMVAAQTRTGDRGPPDEVRIGNDYAGGGITPDQTRLAELGKFEKEHPRTRPAAMVPPDPQMLARGYLTKAGFAPQDLDTVAPILQAAAANVTFERQLKGSGAKGQGPGN
jgi:hypothetical protein